MDDLNVLTEAAVTVTHLQRKTILLTRQWSEGKKRVRFDGRQSRMLEDDS